MRFWLALLLLPPLVFVLPWSVALTQRRWLAAALIFVAWAVAWICLATLWFGVGFAMLLLLGGLAVATTSVGGH